MNLSGASQTLELVTTVAGSIDYLIDYMDVDKSGPSTVTTYGNSYGNIASALTTPVVSAPGASINRVFQSIIARNSHATLVNVVTLQVDVSGSNRIGWSGSLAPSEFVSYSPSNGWEVYTPQGVKKGPTNAVGYTGRAVTFHKSGSAADAIGYWYCTSKDNGFPGAWSAGTSGLNGRATDGTTSTDNGCVPFQNPASGSMYLTAASLFGSVAHPHFFFDCLWVNNGLVVTTTTAQAITSPAFPARDLNGSTNGEGLMIGLLFTGTATNAAVNNTATVSYTNSDGTAGRTATLENVVGMMIPATALIGTLVWFKLAAGDKGVRSIQSITLATSLGAGSISLLVARPVAMINCTVAGIGAEALGLDNPGVKLYNGTCLLHAYRASATTATVVGGQLTMMER